MSHKWWVRPMLHPKLRVERSQYNTLIEELSIHDRARFNNYTRLSPEMFDEVLERLTPRLQRQDTNFRSTIPPGLKLVVFLIYLATGASYTELGNNFQVGKKTVQKFLSDVATAIVEEVVNCPTTHGCWLEIARQLEARWNMPYRFGALDGKHIRIRKSMNSGSVNFTYLCSVPLSSLLLLTLTTISYTSSSMLEVLAINRTLRYTTHQHSKHPSIVKTFSL